MNWMKTITTREGLVSRLYWRLLPVLILSCVRIRLVAGLAESVEYQNMFGMNMLTIEVKT